MVPSIQYTLGHMRVNTSAGRRAEYGHHGIIVVDIGY